MAKKRNLNIDLESLFNRNLKEIRNEMNGLGYDLDYYDDEEIAIGEPEILEQISEEEGDYYFDCSSINYGTSIENKKSVLINLMLEIERLSWVLFENNKTYAADSINIYSPRVAQLFNMVNIVTSNMKFETNKQYSEDNSFLLGKLCNSNNGYNVFMPKKITRTVLNEKDK
jgi:hypothetical protein